MNEQVRAYLDKAKKDKLISMGLIKEMKREYGPYGPIFSKYDKETKQYYFETPIPIDISDEEFEKLIKYEQIKTAAPQDVVKTENAKVKNTAEKALNIYNTVVLVIGLIAAVICVIAGLAGGYSANLALAAIGIGVAITFVLSWAVIKVYVNISNNLHEINSKLK